MGLLNGLSALGQSTAAYASTAGLEAQKQQLAQDNLRLADQLATNRALTVDQPFAERQLLTSEGGQNARAQLSANTSLGVAGIGAASATNVANIQSGAQLQAERERSASAERMNQATIAAPSNEVKTLIGLGVLPPSAATLLDKSGNIAPNAGASAGVTSATTPAQSNAPSGGSSQAPPAGSSAPSSAPSAPSSVINGQAGTTPPAGTSGGSVTDNPLVRNILHLPQAGSEDANRRAIASDVVQDPNFKDASPGQQALEIERRLKVAQGQLPSPETQDALAKQIANYQLEPFSGYALKAAGAAETMEKVFKYNPQYNAAAYEPISKSISAFATGVEGQRVQRLDAGLNHLGVMDLAANALNNDPTRFTNSIANAVAKQFGVAAPNTFDALRGLVAAEVNKAITGGLGTGSERDEIMNAFSAASSPQQLVDITNHYRDLMAGQLDSLRTQFKASTLQGDDGPFGFNNKLSPAVRQELAKRENGAATAPAATPIDNPNAPMTPQQMYGGSNPRGHSPGAQATPATRPPLSAIFSTGP